MSNLSRKELDRQQEDLSKKRIDIDAGLIKQIFKCQNPLCNHIVIITKRNLFFHYPYNVFCTKCETIKYGKKTIYKMFYKEVRE
jgi:hypothetical protein